MENNNEELLEKLKDITEAVEFGYECPEVHNCKECPLGKATVVKIREFTVCELVSLINRAFHK